MKIIVIGASGMIGHAFLRVFNEREDWQVWGTVRDAGVKRFFSAHLAERLLVDIDVLRDGCLLRLMEQVMPDIIINCAGLTKHKPQANDPLLTVPLNTIFPHQLASLCKIAGARLIHISTDCVFSGAKGNYQEDDYPDALDLYGRSKALGEVVDESHCFTLRTSTIGHELESSFGLLAWFLLQEGSCKGYTQAIFSGLPTVVLAQVVRDVVIPRPELTGLYHIAARPIAKYDLLRLIADVYGKDIEIIPDDKLAIDRSLDGARFHEATGYVAPQWPELIKLMHAYRQD